MWKTCCQTETDWEKNKTKLNKGYIQWTLKKERGVRGKMSFKNVLDSNVLFTYLKFYILDLRECPYSYSDYTCHC